MKKAIFLSTISIFLLSTSLDAGFCGSCPGCTPFWAKLVSAAKSIDDRHNDLEKKLNEYYKSNISPLQVQTDLLQLELTRLSANIELLEKEAFIDTRKLERLIKKAHEDTTLLSGDPQ